MTLANKTFYKSLSLSLGISVPGRVPGNMYTDLMRADVIGDPYFRFNDVEYRWVHYDDWTYSTVFMGSL